MGSRIILAEEEQRVDIRLGAQQRISTLHLILTGGSNVQVPAHDSRDFEFARTFGLSIRRVVAPAGGDSSNGASPAAADEGLPFAGGRICMFVYEMENLGVGCRHKAPFETPVFTGTASCCLWQPNLTPTKVLTSDQEAQLRVLCHAAQSTVWQSAQ